MSKKQGLKKDTAGVEKMRSAADDYRRIMEEVRPFIAKRKRTNRHRTEARWTTQA